MNSNWTLINYRELKKQIKNAVSELGTVLELKGVVADTSKLPLTGNKKGDVYIVSEDNTEYVWVSDNASGLITDYEELGPVISGSFLPPVTETDAGKVATVNSSGVWGAQEPIGKKFIVTLTPTAADYSGTMDKTVAEINAAYEAGQEIWFKVLTGAATYVEVPASYVGRDTLNDYPDFGAEIVQYGTNKMIVASTGDTNDGLKITYSTKVYTLTPAT